MSEPEAALGWFLRCIGIVRVVPVEDLRALLCFLKTMIVLFWCHYGRPHHLRLRIDWPPAGQMVIVRQEILAPLDAHAILESDVPPRTIRPEPAGITSKPCTR